MKTVLPLLICFFIGISAESQVIRGRVMSERGTDASSITVSFRNKANSVVTRADGTFDIRATKLPDTLVFSAPGFENYEVVVTEKTVKDPKFEVVLLDKRAALEEVVVTVPYGIMSKRSSAKVRGVAASPVDDLSSVTAGGVSGYTSGTMSRYYTNKKLRLSDSLIRDTIGPRSKLLTAGEVNDFNKWKMWEDFNQNEFKTWSNHWNVYMNTRFSVQLQHTDNTAVIGQEVYLIDRVSMDTVWKAVSDNTGKAELWAGVSEKEFKLGNYMIVSGNQTLRSPSPFVNGMNRMRFANDCDLSNGVEISFVVDATGSMGDEIEFMKLELEDVIRRTFEDHKELDVNVGSVFYRDEHDEYLTRHIPLQNDLLKVLNFIKLQSAGGGGDEPEAVNSALRVALDSMNWSKDARARLMFIILDAPPHDEAKKEMMYLMKKASAMGVRIIPLICSGGSKSAEYLMRCMALATNGTYTFLTDHSGIGGGHTKPTTDAFSVETLNSLLQRLIAQMIFAAPCDDEKIAAPVKVQPVNSENVKIYPNPTRGNIRIESDKELQQVYITDFTGKILMKLSDKTKHTWKADLTSYPAGTYLVKYITKENTWGGEKIIKVH